jgi:glutamate racemase
LAINAHSPIGIFDSGIGGLTIASEVIRKLPNEEVIYFGDTAHMPYGDKSPALVRYYGTKIVEFLIGKGCKIIVIACNTISSVIYDDVVEIFGNRVQFVNVVDPLVHGLARLEQLNKVGIIGTKGTIKTGIYERKLKELRPDMDVHSLATPLLAPMIEAGFFNNQISKAVIETYLKEECFNDIEAMVLACTHYPLIKKDIEEFYQGKVAVYDSTDFVSEVVRDALNVKGLLSTKRIGGPNKFFASDITESFDKTAKNFFGDDVHLEYANIWDL